jgi:integrase
MRTAIKWKMRASDPTSEIDRPPRVPRRERLLTDGEMAALFEALDNSKMKWQIAGAIRFILLTGWRVGEVISLQRSFVDRQRGEARLPDTKTGHSVRPLAGEVLALLDELPRIVGTDYYFPSVTDAKRPLPYNTVKWHFRHLCKRAGVRHASVHLLRHRICTDIASVAPNVRVGMMLSGHRDTATFLAYVHAERERAAAVAETVTGRIAALGKVEPTPVVVLPASHRKAKRR